MGIRPAVKYKNATNTNIFQMQGEMDVAHRVIYLGNLGTNIQPMVIQGNQQIEAILSARKFLQDKITHMKAIKDSPQRQQ